MAANKPNANLPEPTTEQLYQILASYINDPDPSACVVFGKKNTIAGKKGNKHGVPYHFVDKTGKAWKSTFSGADAIIARPASKPSDKIPDPKGVNVKITPVKPEDIMIGDFKKKDTSTMSPEEATVYETKYNKTITAFVSNTNMLAEIGRMLNTILPKAFERWYATDGRGDPDVVPKVYPVWTTSVKTLVEGKTVMKELAIPYFGILARMFKHDPMNPTHVGADQYHGMIGIYWAKEKRFIQTFKKIDPKTNEKRDAYIDFKEGPQPLRYSTAYLFITRNSILRTYTIELAPMTISTFGISFPRLFAPFKVNSIKTHISVISADQLTPEQRQAEADAENEGDLFDTPDAVAVDADKINVAQSGAAEAKSGVDMSAVNAIEQAFAAQTLSAPVPLPQIPVPTPAPAPAPAPAPIAAIPQIPVTAPAPAPVAPAPIAAIPQIPVTAPAPAPAAPAPIAGIPQIPVTAPAAPAPIAGIPQIPVTAQQLPYVPGYVAAQQPQFAMPPQYTGPINYGNMIPPQ